MEDESVDACDSVVSGAAALTRSGPTPHAQTGTGDRDEAVVLAAEHPVVVLDEAVVQVGLGAQALRLSGDGAQIEAALGQLRRGAHVDGAEELIAVLLERGLARRTGDAARTAERLRASSVLVEGLGPCGARIVEHLCSLGVGTVLLRDGRRVGAAEIGGVYRTVHHGQDRAAALQEALRRRPEPTALIGCPPEARTSGVDLHVLCTGPGAWESLRSAAEESPTVLPVELSASGCRIGPFVSAGRLSCPDCLRRHALESDPLWGALQAGLRRTAGEQMHAGDESAQPADPQLEPSPHPGSGGADGPLVEQAATLAVRQISVLRAGLSRASAETAAISVEARSGGVVQHPIAVHPECPCLTMVAAGC